MLLRGARAVGAGGGRRWGRGGARRGGRGCGGGELGGDFPDGMSSVELRHPLLGVGIRERLHRGRGGEAGTQAIRGCGGASRTENDVTG